MSDKDDIARRRKAERERLKNEQRAAAEGAAAEEAAGRRLDSQFDKDIRDLLGGVAPGELDALRKVSSGDDRISIERAQRAIRRGSTPRQRRKAKKAVRAARPAVRRAKKKKGCSLWAVVILAGVGGVLGGVGWTAFELVSRWVGA